MATPHTHGSTPDTLSHNAYQQQYHDAQYDPGLMPVENFGKEVVSSHVQQQQPHQGGYTPVQQQPMQGPPPPVAAPEKRICGVRRPTFIMAVLAALFLAAAIGAGAAAGVAASQNASETCEPSPSESSPPATTSSSPSSTASDDAAFTAIPLMAEPSGLGVPQPKCPGSNLTETAIEGTDLVFRHECGINYPFNDLGNVPMTTMADCLNFCAAQNVRPQGSQGPCIGVSWVYARRQGVDGEACYLKYDMNSPTYGHEYTESAFLVEYFND